DLDDNVGRVESAHAAEDSEDVFVDEEVLPESLLGGDGHASPTAAAASRWVREASSAGSSARASASTRTVWRTLAGSFGRPLTGCGARYRLSASTGILSAGIRGGASGGTPRLGDAA